MTLNKLSDSCKCCIFSIAKPVYQVFTGFEGVFNSCRNRQKEILKSQANPLIFVRVDMKSVLNVEDDKCLLVSFENERGATMVGYQSWIADETKAPEELLKQKIAIWWPKYFGEGGKVKSAQNFLRLKNSSLPENWKKHPVKVLALGGKCDTLAPFSTFCSLSINNTRKVKLSLATFLWCHRPERAQ